MQSNLNNNNNIKLNYRRLDSTKPRLSHMTDETGEDQLSLLSDQHFEANSVPLCEQPPIISKGVKPQSSKSSSDYPSSLNQHIVTLTFEDE